MYGENTMEMITSMEGHYSARCCQRCRSLGRRRISCRSAGVLAVVLAAGVAASVVAASVVVAPTVVPPSTSPISPSTALYGNVGLHKWIVWLC